MIVEVNFIHLLIAVAIISFVYTVIGYHCGKQIGRARTLKLMVEMGYKPPNTAMIWEFLLRNLCNDNNIEITRTKEDYERARPGLEKLIKAGYFVDNPYELTSSFWIMAAGEGIERVTYFEREPEGFRVVDAVLNDLFDRAA